MHLNTADLKKTVQHCSATGYLYISFLASSHNRKVYLFWFILIQIPIVKTFAKKKEKKIIKKIIMQCINPTICPFWSTYIKKKMNYNAIHFSVTDMRKIIFKKIIPTLSIIDNSGHMSKVRYDSVDEMITWSQQFIRSFKNSLK